jgi:hypothetical protein
VIPRPARRRQKSGAPAPGECASSARRTLNDRVKNAPCRRETPQSPRWK